jgi:Protein of unknown function (DUF3551)
MRSTLVALAILVAAALAPSTAVAQNARWCAQSDLTGIPDCSFYTLAQCRTSGQYGQAECFRNPRAARAQARGVRRQR